MTIYIVQVADNSPSGWHDIMRYMRRYEAMAAYNNMEGRRRVIVEFERNWEVIRSSDEDGRAADYAANNQRSEA